MQNMSKRVRFIENVSALREMYQGGHEYDVSPEDAAQYVRAGFAEELEQPEPSEPEAVKVEKPKRKKPE